ncbi:MAG: hypothetical protein L3K10_02865 [Thermoplasmata archaeon]|nr:hypothetical protein [Thermoplasmata archaeon]
MKSMIAPIVVFLALSFVLVAVLPTASASSPVKGSATSCTGIETCKFSLAGGNGSGWAATNWAWGTSRYAISFQLSGEPNATHGGLYVAKVVNVSGNVSHVLGNFSAVDVNNGKVVLGSTDTNVTVTTHCYHTGCSHTYFLKDGTIQLRTTKYDGTTTTVSCSPSSFSAGGSTVCTATVTDLANHSKAPKGNVSFSTLYSSSGTFSKHGVCTLISGSCSVRFSSADDTVGTVSIYAAYNGGRTFYKSSSSTSIYISGSG